MNKVFAWIGAIFTPFGLVFAAIGGWFWLDHQGFARDAVRAEGTVVGLEESFDSDGSTYRPVVVFADAAGREHRFTGRVGSNPPGYSRGETVTVLHPPGAPREARVDGFLENSLFPLVFGGMGLVFATIGAGFLFAWQRRRRIVARLLATGLPVQAKFVECFRDTRIKVNGRSPFRVSCQAVHPATGKLHSFESDPVWADPTEQIGSKTLRVLVDPTQPKHYHVDLSPYLDEQAMA